MTGYCPNCGIKQEKPARIVTVEQVNQEDTRISEVKLEVFNCPACRTMFTQNAAPQSSSTAALGTSGASSSEKLSSILQGFKQNLENLRQNLNVLQTERSSVLFELETIRKDQECRADVLEEDVNRLRLEIQDLKEVLGLNEAVTG